MTSLVGRGYLGQWSCWSSSTRLFWLVATRTDYIPRTGSSLALDFPQPCEMLSAQAVFGSTPDDGYKGWRPGSTLLLVQPRQAHPTCCAGLIAFSTSASCVSASSPSTVIRVDHRSILS